MNENEKLAFFISQRIKGVDHLEKLFDLLHDYTEKGFVPEQFGSAEELQLTKNTLLTVCISYTYSCFDKCGINIQELRPEGRLLPIKDPLENVLETWSSVCDVVKKIRHNDGFHGGREKQLNNATQQWKDLQPRVLVDLHQKLLSLSSAIDTALNGGMT